MNFACHGDNKRGKNDEEFLTKVLEMTRYSPSGASQNAMAVESSISIELKVSAPMQNDTFSHF